MTIRPPTLREKRRYILVCVEPSGTIIDQKDLFHTVCDAITSLWGDATAAVITPAVIGSEGQYKIIRCRRGTERELSLALTTITYCRENGWPRISLHASEMGRGLYEELGFQPTNEMRLVLA
jgi:ribonuclease P/MRP protein subunit POP5